MLRVLCLFIAIAAPSGATTVLAVRTEERVVLAADSRVQFIGNQQSTISIGCKVHLTSGIVWSHAGYYANPTTGFDLEAIVARAFAENSSFDARLQRLAGAVSAPLHQALLALRAADRRTYDEDVEAPLKIIAAKMEVAVPVLAVVQFERASTGVLSHRIYRCPGDCPTGVQYVSAGMHREADRMVEATPAYFSQQGWRNGMRTLLDSTAAAHPGQVSAPYTVVEIGPAEVQWLDPGLCRER